MKTYPDKAYLSQELWLSLSYLGVTTTGVPLSAQTLQI